MFFKMVFLSLVRQKGKMSLIALTVCLGGSLCTSMLNLMFGVGDKVNKELKTYGANIRVLPQSATLISDLYGSDFSETQFLKEDELGKIKTIFWAFNIVDFAPFLEGEVSLNNKRVSICGSWFNHHLSLPTGEELDTGLISMKSWWALDGVWLKDNEEGVIIGKALAKEMNIHKDDTIELKGSNSRSFKVVSILDSGDEGDSKIFMNLKYAQELLDLKGLINSIEISALTSPDNELSRRAAQDPESLTPQEMETWYCTAYVSSICYQIQEVITNASCKPVRQVAESEGTILEKTKSLMLLITILSLIGSSLGISNLVTSSVMERSKEIGLLKALGATETSITLLILTEIFITSLVGGAIGYFVGLGFNHLIGISVFGSVIEPTSIVIPLVSVLILLVTLIGSLPSMRLLLKLEPSEVLHGGH